eukprot:scaffold95608_cov66-Phaeocystis_antarctica.AAC.1
MQWTCSAHACTCHSTSSASWRASHGAALLDSTLSSDGTHPASAMRREVSGSTARLRSTAHKGGTHCASAPVALAATISWRESCGSPPALTMPRAPGSSAEKFTSESSTSRRTLRLSVVGSAASNAGRWSCMSAGARHDAKRSCLTAV